MFSELFITLYLEQLFGVILLLLFIFFVVPIINFGSYIEFKSFKTDIY